MPPWKYRSLLTAPWWLVRILNGHPVPCHSLLIKGADLAATAKRYEKAGEARQTLFCLAVKSKTLLPVWQRPHPLTGEIMSLSSQLDPGPCPLFHVIARVDQGTVEGRETFSGKVGGWLPLLVSSPPSCAKHQCPRLLVAHLLLCIRVRPHEHIVVLTA
jgi:hypothetical protein